MQDNTGIKLTLGDFLKAKRAATPPESVGLPLLGRPRRVPGLRREELAQLAGVSVDYYIRLEQGRMTHASTTVLNALAQALRLSEHERSYLFSLAGAAEPRAVRSSSQAVDAQTQRLLDSLVDTPAIVLGRRLDVLAWNALGTALFIDFAALRPEDRNFARLIFLEPRFRELYMDWEEIASGFVAMLRMDAARYSDDPQLVSLIGELAIHDADFRRWWANHKVEAITSGRKRINHPIAGPLHLDWQALQVASNPDQTVVIHTAVPDSPTLEAFQFLTAWADRHATLTQQPDPELRLPSSTT
ncbi:helix-turn-helix domain-containing protein [Kitasatospora kifunensis]|uniref:Transcriptional regulator with XRE-family HTH domain n=1 Tax=Kitasatospora kifunensis TaxID=58351 RepID=A0A7W7VTA4_KITKI|nr:helix-turn-helix transcriptional regulator [Kitasatospora kifunensis]MBB4922017.1 transcriptional regulator with XRE-family HTH domain [Kitasatospora kifunensis]